MLTDPPEVVVVAYGPVELLTEALRSLGPGLDAHIVDNGRSDDVGDLARRHGADYVRPSRNVGFAAAVNLGLRRCTPGRDVLLLNPDARLTTEGLLALQRALYGGPVRCAAVAPRLQRPDGSLERTSWPMPSPLEPWRGIFGRRPLRHGDPFFLSGAVLLLSGRALADVGAFDERFFLYAEEADWQRRARGRGWEMKEVDTVQAGHVGSATSSDVVLRERIFHRSAELFIRKWHGTSGWTVFWMGSLLAACRRLVTARDPASRRRATLTCRIYLGRAAPRLPDDAGLVYDC